MAVYESNLISIYGRLKRSLSRSSSSKVAYHTGIRHFVKAAICGRLP